MYCIGGKGMNLLKKWYTSQELDERKLWLPFIFPALLSFSIVEEIEL